MKTTIKHIRSFGPCYDPNRYLPENWEGNVVDILKMKEVPAKDRLWVAVRPDFLSDRQLHLYGLFCARQCEAHSTDSRVKECNDTVEAYLSGKATKEQLHAARSAAESAAWSAAWSAESAARSAASAAWSAAWSAASAAWSAAWSAASAARSAARSAASAARSAASAAEEQQCEYLIKLLEGT